MAHPGNEMFFTLNDFMFCIPHGNEYCHQCCCDHRMCNNIQIEDELGEEVRKMFTEDQAEELLEDLGSDDRKPLANVFSLGAVDTGKKSKSGGRLYHCLKHSTMDCPECFNWVKIIIGAATGHQQTHKIVDRAQIISFLKSMHVEIPVRTKMSDEDLEKKLSTALNYAQQIHAFDGNVFPVKPGSLKDWPQNKSLFEAMKRTNVAEAMQLYTAATQGRPSPHPDLYQDAFADVRETTLHFAKNYENGIKACILKDREDTGAICVRILDIKMLNKDTPIIFLSYHAAERSDPASTHRTLNFVSMLMRAGGVPQITCTDQEQALIFALLEENRKRISSQYKPKLATFEKGFNVSFVVPIGPLDQVHIGKLSLNTGCEVCGNKVASRCVQCQSVSYCGKECQKVDWKNHKTFCKSLKDAIWETLTFVNELNVGGEQMHMAYISNSASTREAKIPARENDGIQPNIHGDKPFLVKLQRPLTGPTDTLTAPWIGGPPPFLSMMVYDRQRSFRGHVMAKDNQEAWVKAMAEMPKSKTGMKIYRWAKRTADDAVTVSLDRGPEPEPTW